MLLFAAGNGQAQNVVNFGCVNRNFVDQATIVAAFDANLTRELTRGLTCDEVNGAAQGVATKQGALRATQNFNALQVDHVKQGALIFTDKHAVDIHADGWVHPDRGLACAKTANGGGRDQTRNRCRNHVQVGDGALQVGSAFNLAIF